MDWDSTDFLIAGTLIGGMLLIFLLVKRLIKKKRYRRIVFLIIVSVFLLIWMELGLGIFGTKWAGN